MQANAKRKWKICKLQNDTVSYRKHLKPQSPFCPLPPPHRPTPHIPRHDPHDDGTDTNGRSSDGRPAPNRRKILVEIFCSGHATISCRCRYRCCTGGHPIPRPRNTGPPSHHSHTMEATGAGAGVGCHCSRRFLEAAISARRAIRQGQK